MNAIPGTTLEFQDDRIGGYINHKYVGSTPGLNDEKYMLSQEQAENMLSDCREILRKYFPWTQDFVVFQFEDGTVRLDSVAEPFLHIRH
jgi:hypothetical protein